MRGPPQTDLTLGLASVEVRAVFRAEMTPTATGRIAEAPGEAGRPENVEVRAVLRIGMTLTVMNLIVNALREGVRLESVEARAVFRDSGNPQRRRIRYTPGR